MRSFLILICLRKEFTETEEREVGAANSGGGLLLQDTMMAMPDTITAGRSHAKNFIE